jgi:peptide/nickel transport system permease protein
MKAGYIFSRLLMIIPTVLIVIIVSFFLFSTSGADPVRSVLQLQGLDENDRVSAEGYNKAYEEETIKQGRHLPSFYFSVVPSYYPDTLHRLLYPQKKEFAKKLLYRYKDWPSVENYLQALEKMQSHQQIPPIINQTLLILNQDIHNTNLTTLFASIENDVNTMPSEQQKDFAVLKTKVFELNQNTRNWFYPVLNWNGSKNQFHQWMVKIIGGDFGFAMVDGKPVWAKISKALLWSLSLSLLSILVASFMSILLGLITGYYQDSIFDKIIFSLLFGIYSIPLFWLATMMIVFFTTEEFGSWTNLFPSVGLFYSGDGSVLSTMARHSKLLILPIFCISIHSLAYLGKQIRASIVEEKSKNYYLTGLAKGMSPFQVLWKHSLPNSLLPFVTIIIGAIPASLAGALIIEVLFNIPGMGRLMYDSILNNDWNVIAGIIILISIVTTIVYFIGDVIYSMINPRITFG